MSNAIEFKSPEAAQIFAEQSLLQLHEANQRIVALTAENESLQAELDRYRINLRGEAEQHDELREKFSVLFEENESLQSRLREVATTLLCTPDKLEAHARNLMDLNRIGGQFQELAGENFAKFQEAKQRADAAEAKLAAVREIVQRKMTAPVHTRDDHSGCDWCKVAEVLK